MSQSKEGSKWSVRHRQEGGCHLRIPFRVSQQHILVGLGHVLGRVSDEEVLLGRDQERSIRHETKVEVGRIAEVTQQLRRPLRREREVEPLRLASHVG